MGTRAITGVLGLLRRLKRTEGLGSSHSMMQYLQVWSNNASPSVTLRLCVSIQEEIEDAISSVQVGSLTEEAKEGLLSTLSSLQIAFSIESLGNALANYVPAIDSAITNFAIVSSLVGAEFSDEVMKGVKDLIVELENLRDSAEINDIDDVLRRTVLRQVNAIIALLHNASAVGIDAAISAYFDLVLQMRRSESSEESSEARATIWAKIASWRDRLIKLADLVDAGAKVIPVLEKAPEFLKLLG